MTKDKRTLGWLIAAAILAVAAVGFLLYAVLNVRSSDINRKQNEVIQGIAHSSSTAEPVTASPETAVPPQTTTSVPEKTEALPETTTEALQTATSATETATVPSQTATTVPETTTVPPQTTTSAPETTTAPPQTTTPPVTTVAPETTAPLSPLPEGFPPEADAKIDFDALKKECADIYAWITVPGVDVDLPILRHPTDDSFYLNHDLYGKENKAGAIFTESYNSKDFSDFITVVYGHSMRDGTMFAPLLEFRDRDYFDKHRYAIVYTEEKTLIYQIFAAYRWDDRHILRNYDFSGDLMRYSYISYVLNIRDMYSVIADDVDVDTDDRILTLSCCTYVDGNRFIVQGVLVGER